MVEVPDKVNYFEKKIIFIRYLEVDHEDISPVYMVIPHFHGKDELNKVLIITVYR